MSDHYHYKTPQYCDTCGTELEKGWLDKYEPYYSCPECSLWWTKKQLRLERKQRKVIAEYNATGKKPDDKTKPKPDYTGTLFEGLM